MNFKLTINRNTWLKCALLFIAAFICEFSVAQNKLILHEVAWLSPKSNLVDALSKQPAECLNPTAPAIASIGRIAFESPALLGGQAAKMELSCSGCHRAGRGNPDFFITPISTQPGTADITHSFFSSHGGDNKVSAVPIPDLAYQDQVSIKDRQSIEFRDKLSQLIEIEFDGQPAPKIILDGLQVYLANIDIIFCQTESNQTISLDQDWQRLMESVNALTIHTDHATNVFLIRAARKRLERIYLRFKTINNHKTEGQIIKLSRKLERLSLRNIDVKTQQKKLPQWMQTATLLHTKLKNSQDRSLYNIDIIKQNLMKK